MMTYRELIVSRDIGCPVWPIFDINVIAIETLVPYKVVGVTVDTTPDTSLSANCRKLPEVYAALVRADDKYITSGCSAYTIYETKQAAATKMLAILNHSLPEDWHEMTQYDGVEDLIKQLTELADAPVPASEPICEATT